MNEHKQEIVSTRKGCLGSSDGNMLLAVAKMYGIPKSAYKRLAECKGLIEHTDIPRTAAIVAGDVIEDCVYQSLKATDERYQSNPRLESEKYSRKNVKLISHIDFMLQDDENKVLTMVECKASKHSTEQVRQEYKAQLFIHKTLGEEYIHKLGKGWKLKLLLCHYDTSGLNLEDGIEFDPSRLTVRPVRIEKSFFDLGRVMDDIDTFLESYNEYIPNGDDVDYTYLPEKVREKFDAITQVLVEIKERESLVEEFKQRLYSFMSDNDIKSIKSDTFSIARIDPTVQHSFDYKKFLEDERMKHPKKTRALEKKYDKATGKKGYAKIALKNNK